MINIEISGLEETRKYLKKIEQNTKNSIPIGLKKATLYTQGKVKESIARGTNAPMAVDTGRFLNSVTFSILNEEATQIYTDLSYAKHIEYGTSKMPSRPHFRNTKAKEQRNINQFISDEVKSAINKS